MNSNRRGATKEGLNSIATAYYVSGPIIDTGNGLNVGPACFCMGRVFAAPNTDTVFPHSLGRIPNGFKMIRASVAGTLYDATTGAADWTRQSIKLRATAAGTYSFELI